MARRVARRSKAILNLSRIKWISEQSSFKTFVICGALYQYCWYYDIIIFSVSLSLSSQLNYLHHLCHGVFLIHTCVERVRVNVSQIAPDSNIFPTFHGSKRYAGSTTGLFASAIYRLHLSCFFPRPRSDRAPGKTQRVLIECRNRTWAFLRRVARPLFLHA